METKSTKVSKSAIYSEIDISKDLVGIPKSDQSTLKDQLGELLVEQILESLADVRSPVQGGKYKTKLSADYAKKKKAETGSSAANLDLTGEMINSIDYKIKGNTIQIGVFGSDAGKADGHNNFSGMSKLPTRQFLPEAGQNFRKDIQTLLSDTIDGYRADITELDSSKLKNIETTKELYQYLADQLGLSKRSEIKSMVLESKNLLNALDKYNLVDLLNG